LTTIKNEQGGWVGYQQTVPGKSVTDILPGIVQEALAALPIPKRMRWGSHTVEFVRPAHSVIMLYGEDIIEAEILGLTAGRDTQGHRFHSAGTISITSPADYATQLEEQGFVIADFNHRKAVIWDQVQALIQQAFHGEAQAVVEDELLNEVTGLVEWPVAIMGSFDDSFLAVPAEALISAMQDHQRYFPVKDLQGNLLPYFITISNIAGHDMPRIIAGNKRVLRARLSDAAFFFETDKKQSLVSRVEGLKAVVFQAKLGSLHDKAQRLSQLTQLIATEMQEIATQEAARLGLLAKTDLITTLVGEFPELQGTAGYYYALHDGEPALIAEALKEQYLPRFSGDVLPNSTLGCAIALADRLDTLVGVFGINQVPTGDKDPFGLRRAALGVLRILIEKELNLDLRTLVIYAWKGYEEKLENTNTVNVFSILFKSALSLGIKSKELALMSLLRCKH
jgi:glycyl-tRNA synthetase beta chain